VVRFGWKRTALLAVIAAITMIGIFCALHPRYVLFTLVIGLDRALANKEPPRILRYHFPAEGDWGPGKHESVAAFFQQLFPPGMRAVTMIRILRNQGFDNPRLPNLPCYPKGQPPGIGAPSYICYDPTKSLVYGWSTEFGCGARITVKWTADDRDAITKLDASYWGGCV
jgi:hypothetical protein